MESTPGHCITPFRLVCLFCGSLELEIVSRGFLLGAVLFSIILLLFEITLDLRSDPSSVVILFVVAVALRFGFKLLLISGSFGILQMLGRYLFGIGLTSDSVSASVTVVAVVV